MTGPPYKGPGSVTERTAALTDAARELRATVLDIDDSFWPRLPQFISLMQPIRLAIHTLQGDQAKVSDVMGAFIRIHNTQTTFMLCDARARPS